MRDWFRAARLGMEWFGKYWRRVHRVYGWHRPMAQLLDARDCGLETYYMCRVMQRMTPETWPDEDDAVGADA